MRKIVQIAFLTFCFSCQKSPESVVLRYCKIANEVVNGDTSEVAYLRNYLSKNAQNRIDSLPLLMSYSLLSLTKKGTLAIAEVKNRQAVTKDSVILTIDLIYIGGHVQAIQQAMVFEENEWKLSISSQ